MARVGRLISLVLILGSVTSRAQDHQEHGTHHSPYADQASSGIAALSQSEVEDLESGAGMGLARAAELNHYPGPKHALELAEEMNLSEEQLAEVEEIHREMLAEAKRIGQEVLEHEATLDRRFAHRHIDASTLAQITQEIGTLRGELRFAHLVAHLRVASLLTGDQIDAYDSLRGYETDVP